MLFSKISVCAFLVEDQHVLSSVITHIAAFPLPSHLHDRTAVSQVKSDCGR